MRWICTGIILLSFTGLGLCRLHAQETGLRALLALCTFMQEFLRALESTRADLGDLLNQTCRRCGLQVPFEKEGLLKGLGDEERRLGQRFFAGLGSSPMAQQRAHCADCIEEGARLLAQQRAQAGQRRRLTLSLSVLGGLFVAILFQ